MEPGSSAQLNKALTVVQGETWIGIPEIIITVDGVAPTADVASCKFVIKENHADPNPIVTLTNASGITINSANDWNFTIPQQVLSLRSGNYVWAFQTTDNAGVIRTYLTGALQVLQPYA